MKSLDDAITATNAGIHTMRRNIKLHNSLDVHVPDVASYFVAHRQNVERLVMWFGEHGEHTEDCDLSNILEYDPARGFFMRRLNGTSWQTDKPPCTCGYEDALAPFADVEDAT